MLNEAEAAITRAGIGEDAGERIAARQADQA